MTNTIQLRRGVKANLPTLATGEPAFTTDTNELYIGNGGTNVKVTAQGSGGGGGTYINPIVAATHASSAFTITNDPAQNNPLTDMKLTFTLASSTTLELTGQLNFTKSGGGERLHVYLDGTEISMNQVFESYAMPDTNDYSLPFMFQFACTSGAHTVSLYTAPSGNTNTVTYYERSMKLTDIGSAAGVYAVQTATQVNKIQLAYVASTDIANNQAVPATTWTTPTSWVDQTFTVDDPTSLVTINLAANATMQVSNNQLGVSIVLDPATTNTRYVVGGNWTASGAYDNVFAGTTPLELNGLTAGTHTVRVQVWASNTASFYWRCSTGSNYEFCRLTVIEHKITNTGIGGTLSEVRAHTSAAVSVTNSAETTLTFDTNDYDTASMHSITTNTSRFTAPVPGKYRMTTTVRWPSAISGDSALHIKKNGSIYLASAEISNGSVAQNVSAEADFAAGDYVEAVVYQNGSIGSTSTNGSGTSFTMSRIDGYAINPMTTLGDIQYGGASGVPTRLPVGSNGQVLSLVSGLPSWATPSSGGGSGSVTSVGLSTSGVLHSITGSPVTSSGTISLTLNTQNANLVFAGPTSGAAATPTMRALVAADISAVNPSALTGSGLVPPAALASTASISNGQVLTWNTGGTLSWTTPSGGTATSIDGGTW